MTLKGYTRGGYATICRPTHMKQSKEHQKPKRLKDFPYRGCYRYFITIRSSNFRHHFVQGDVVAKVIEFLKSTADQEGFSVWAYCFMPDHVHLLIEGKHTSADMKHFVALFKQETAYWFKSVYAVKLWEANYYEHVLRNDEATMAVAKYIMLNPVRKGIVDDYSSYPYSGSFEVEDICSL
jgi:putative transposase